MLPAHGVKRGAIDFESQARGEPHRAQQAQMIFAETRFGVADGADHAPLQVASSIHVVQHAAVVRVHHQPVDGEIAA